MQFVLERAPLARFFDVRRGEERGALVGLAGLLMLIIAAHTVMETARDTLLLTGPGPRALGFVYMIIATLTVPCAALASRAGERFGQRRALGGTVAVAILAAISLFLLPSTHTTAIAIYVLSGIIGSIVVPQFWTLAGNALTVAQGRRLFGLISAAGILGGVIGSGAAGAALTVIPVKGLLLVSASVFVAAGLVLARFTVPGSDRAARFPPRTSVASSLRAFREQPFLWRVALLVALSTATFIAIDYDFKSTIAHALPAAAVGPFVARYYMVLNGVSLFVQVFLGSAIVRKMGIVAAVGLTPFVLGAGAIGAFATGGTLAAVLLLKGIDGSLRYSIHRITSELVYLPIPASARQRAKPIIDGGLGRTVQTLSGVALLALGGTQALSPRPFAAAIAILALVWFGAAVTIRRSYLALLWRGLSRGTLDVQDSPDPLDVETVELLVQSLASDDPLEVLAAMNALARRGRDGVVPALLLLHPDASVLIHALDMFGASSRSDWFTLGRKLLDDPRDTVRMAALRALAKHGQLDYEGLAKNAGARVRGYAAVDSALRAGVEDAAQHPPLAALVARHDETSTLGMLAAIADARPTASLSRLLLELAAEPGRSLEKTELLALAATRQTNELMIPHLVAMLSVREGREAVRSALVAFQNPAFEEVSRVLGDRSQPRRLRIHMPKTLARFRSKRAMDRLLVAIGSDQDGLVRYKSIRALAALTVDIHVELDRSRLEDLAHAQLIRYFEVLRLRAALGAPSPAAPGAAGRLLRALLDEKLRQALDRALQLVQIGHPRGDIRGVRTACLSGDAITRANAGELLDALLSHRRQRALRELFDVINDDLTVAERVEQSTRLLPGYGPATHDEALVALVGDTDGMISTLAMLHAGDLGSEPLRAEVERARRARPAAFPVDERFLSGTAPPVYLSHA